ncbi:hypothetical protein [Neolewinella agarilytica]|uniref:Vacuolar ATPase assembly integral membrane protein VMA21 n=1 Tax=Neolewinella agarilytica TaxID=478744 RepID=A0A1H9F9E9_9BACT|nr:hypothetical protein [Neolewinella agarilytica]SEQ34564.1 hypothetical protein SAMN05444359_108141 [Neolewinella agarilytica]
MLSPRLQRTLIYCLVAFCFIAPMYYLVYGFVGENLSADQRLQTSLIYGAINTLFLGAIHYFLINKPRE